MTTGKRGWTLKILSALCAALFVGAGNVLGVLAGNLVQGSQWALMRWGVTGVVWLTGVALSALLYALGAAWDRIDVMEMWLNSLDTAVRNSRAGESV